jgi:anthranilate phosphoribosyltransferase
MVRRDLGVRTIFNLLGPLTNPAGAPFQVVGVSSEAACEKVARALARLGTRRAWVVRGEDGLDEITLAGKTVVYSASPEDMDRFEIAPEDFGLPRAPIDHLRGGSAEENASIIMEVIEGRRKDEARDLVLINAAAALFVSGAANSLDGAVEMAARSIDTGGALAKLQALRQSSHDALRQ